MDRRETPARAGLLVDGYELTARRVDHGLGDAWLARRPHHAEDEVVVKFVAPVPGDPTVVPPAFDETMRKVQRATSPGLVTVRRWGATAGWIHVVTEVIEARPLDDWLAGHREAGTRPPPGVALWLFDGLCGAVQSAHRQGVVHGAISPRSVLLHPLSPGTYHGWILDLGLAPWLTEASALAEIDAPPPEYQSPEQLDPRGSVTVRADLFALSLLLVELFTLTATPGSAARETAARMVTRDHARLVESLKKLRDDVHEDFWVALADTLHPDPSRRPESAQQLKARVRAAAHNASLWRDVPEPMQEPPPPKSLRGAPGDGTPAPRAQAQVPEGWQHAERVPSRVDPEALKGMLSQVARKRRATAAPIAPPQPAVQPAPPLQPALAPPLQPPPSPPPHALPPPQLAPPVQPPPSLPPHASPAPQPSLPPKPQPARAVLGKMRLQSTPTPTPSVVPSFLDVGEADEGTVRTSSEQLAELTSPSFMESSDPFAGSERRAAVSAPVPEVAPSVEGLADATLRPGYMRRRPASPEVQSPPAPERAPTRPPEEPATSPFATQVPSAATSLPRGRSASRPSRPTEMYDPDQLATKPAVDISALPAHETLVAPRGIAAAATSDVAEVMQTIGVGRHPSFAPPTAGHATPNARPPTMPPAAPSYLPPPPNRAHPMVSAEPFVLRPPDGMPVASTSGWWVLAIAAAIVLAAAAMALLIVFA